MRYGRPHFGVSSGLSGLAVCVAVSSLLVALSSCAQEIASPSRHSANDLAFRCFVADSTGHPLSGIPVELRSSVPPLDEIQALTEADGSYTFGGLRSGDYLLTVAGGLLLPPSHVFVKSTPPRAMTVRLPIALAGSHGHGTGVVSVKQLNVPAKVQESSQRAYRAWLHSDFRQSRLLAQQTLQQRPDYAPALELLGMTDFVERHTAEAVNELVQALRQDPISPRAYLVLASAYNELHQYSDALNPLSILSKLTPDVWQLHYEMGRAYLGQARYEAAMLEFEHAQNLSRQEISVVHLGKAHVLLGLGDYAGAHDELNNVLRDSSDGPLTAESRELALAVDAHLKKEATTNPGTIARGGPKIEH